MKLNYDVEPIGKNEMRTGRRELIELLDAFMESGKPCAAIEDIGKYKSAQGLRTSLDVVIKRHGYGRFTVSRGNILHLVRGQRNAE